MSEVEKQEGQKTVVAFITGLLIGGLLVWVFSASPETQKNESPKTETDTEVATENKNDGNPETITNNDASPSVKVSLVAGDGKLAVSDQKAGDTVALGETKYPSESGWIAVRDYKDSVPGNILGAARFNLKEGLLPTSVLLLRKTVTGSSYQVVFYTDNGDKTFSPKEDQVMAGGEDTFKAE